MSKCFASHINSSRLSNIFTHPFFCLLLVDITLLAAATIPTTVNTPSRNSIEFPTGQFAHGNNEDKTLEAKPPEVEAKLDPAVAVARFDFFVTEPTFRPAKIEVEYVTQDESKLAPGYYFVAPFDCGTIGPQIFDQNGVSFVDGSDHAGGG